MTLTPTDLIAELPAGDLAGASEVEFGRSPSGQDYAKAAFSLREVRRFKADGSTNFIGTYCPIRKPAYFDWLPIKGLNKSG